MASSGTEWLWAPAARVRSDLETGPARRTHLEANGGDHTRRRGRRRARRETSTLANTEHGGKEGRAGLVTTSFFAKMFTFPHVMQEAKGGTPPPTNYLRTGTGSISARALTACLCPATHRQPKAAWPHGDRTHALLHDAQNTHACLHTTHLAAYSHGEFPGDAWLCFNGMGVTGRASERTVSVTLLF